MARGRPGPRTRAPADLEPDSGTGSQAPKPPRTHGYWAELRGESIHGARRTRDAAFARSPGDRRRPRGVGRLRAWTPRQPAASGPAANWGRPSPNHPERQGSAGCVCQEPRPDRMGGLARRFRREPHQGCRGGHGGDVITAAAPRSQHNRVPFGCTPSPIVRADSGFSGSASRSAGSPQRGRGAGGPSPRPFPERVRIIAEPAGAVGGDDASLSSGRQTQAGPQATAQEDRHVVDVATDGESGLDLADGRDRCRHPRCRPPGYQRARGRSASPSRREGHGHPHADGPGHRWGPRRGSRCRGG